ncbi:MAG: hypothetical protein LJE94_02635 [Deltaproteobacteria bacterium]|nr:hypothetical protein [Deltaproteobacteria bacterium]
MNEHMEEIAISALIVCLLALFPGSAQSSEPLVTVSGVVSDEGQLFGDDGVIYEIADNEMGFDLMEMSGCRVNVKGHVMTTDETLVLVAVEFEVTRE